MRKTLAFCCTIAAAFSLAACTGGDGAGGGEQSAGGPPVSPPPPTLVTRPHATGGEALYVQHCAMCHAPGGMGFGLLDRRMDQPNLELREDLTADFVVLAARQGIGNMPSIPRGDVPDEDLDSIAAYLAAGPHEVAP